MRTVKRIHNARYSPIADLITYSPLPSAALPHLDPFLFLNHHGYQRYQPYNHGLPFGPHPHRGMETVTFIISGDISHKDSGGHESVIGAGGVQWMTAGRGLIHAEVSSAEFKRNGGELEILQLWVNLPRALKMTEPWYSGKQKDEIPKTEVAKDVLLDVISGNWNAVEGAFQPKTNIAICLAHFKAGSSWKLSIPKDHTIFFYVIKGKLLVNTQDVEQRQLAEFENNDESLDIIGQSDSLLLLGHAAPLNEPIVARGPFVMNSEAEIEQAYKDYHEGKFGSWNY